VTISHIVTCQKCVCVRRNDITREKKLQDERGHLFWETRTNLQHTNRAIFFICAVLSRQKIKKEKEISLLFYSSVGLLGIFS
jgi:hypothetical protein